MRLGHFLGHLRGAAKTRYLAKQAVGRHRRIRQPDHADNDRRQDAGGAPIFIPPDADTISIASDGTISSGDQLIGQIGLVTPNDPNAMTRETGVLFHAEAGYTPMDDGRMVQGFLEDSNVDPILQMARMIEVQRAYELGQSFLKNEDERVRAALQTFVK